MCDCIGLQQAQLLQLQENHKPLMQTLEKTSNHSTWNSSALPSDGRLAPRRQYFSDFQIHAMEQGAGSFFSPHGHGQLICSPSFFPSVTPSLWLRLHPPMSMLLVSCHHPIYLAAYHISAPSADCFCLLPNLAPCLQNCFN